MRGLFLDLNGVLFDDRGPIPGAVAAVQAARRRGHVLRFVTNTATRSHLDMLAWLRRMGFTIADEELFTAPLVTRHYLLRQGLRPYCLVHPAIQPLFADLAGNPPDCVVLGDARDALGYAALNRVFQLVRQGLPLIGIGMNRCFVEQGEWMLDAGAFIRAIEWAADSQAIIMGKPSADFFRELCDVCNLPPGDCLMIGDDVEADVAGAMAIGMRGGLVRTGKFQPRDLDRLPPDALLLDDITGIATLADG